MHVRINEAVILAIVELCKIEGALDVQKGVIVELLNFETRPAGDKTNNKLLLILSIDYIQDSGFKGRLGRGTSIRRPNNSIKPSWSSRSLAVSLRYL